MTVSRTYLRQMKAEQENRWMRQEIENLDDPHLLRLRLISEKYADPDDPARLLGAQFQEVMRRYAIEAGVCGDCLAKFPDPLA